MKRKALPRRLLGSECEYCEGILNLTLDHIIPVSQGGTDAEENLQTLCRKCNSFKADRTEEEFREWLEIWIQKTEKRLETARIILSKIKTKNKN